MRVKASASVPLPLLLTTIVAGMTAFNFAVMSLFPDDDPPEAIYAIIIGVWAFEPMMLALWAAFGTGRWLTRLPLVVPCVLLIVGVPGLLPENFKQVEQFEFIVLAMTAFAMFAAALVVFAIVRGLTGWKIARNDELAFGDVRPLQFDIKYLMALVTLYAMAFGITASLRFAAAEPAGIILGPDFYVFVMAMGGGIVSLLLLPIITIPVFVLIDKLHKSLFWRAAAFWLTFTVAAGFLAFLVSSGSEPVIVHMLLIQFGGVIAGLAAALPLRWAGCRLVRRQANSDEIGVPALI